MFKNSVIIIITVFLLFSCSKKKDAEIISELTDEEIAVNIYIEGVEALKVGDAFYAAKKFREVESLLPQNKWASKASLMASYADYSRNAYGNAIFNLERHIDNSSCCSTWM